MKQASFVGILLTFLAFLLVLVAGVIFLFNQSRGLDRQLEAQRVSQAELSATRDQLLSDLAVRESARGAAESTRETLAGQIEDSQQQLAAIQDQLSQSEALLEKAQNDLVLRALQGFIFSPRDGAQVTPAVPIDLFIAATADAGVASVVVTVNEDELQTIPAEGQSIFTFRTTWTPPEEGEYAIAVMAHDQNGRASAPAAVTISAAFANEQERNEALLRELQANLIALRYPGQTLSTTEVGESALADDLHLSLLHGDNDYSQQDAIDDALILSAFDFSAAGEDLQAYSRLVADPGLIGYYEPGTATFSLVDAETSPGTLGRWLQIHDFVHDLQDEQHELGQIYNAIPGADARAALLAFVEGEANYLQSRYLEGGYFDQGELAEIGAALSSARLDLSQDIPPFLMNRYEFAHSAGSTFVRALDSESDFAALDMAWRNLPQSTEQILHPDRYLRADVPVNVTLEALEEVLGEDWRLVKQDTFGEFHLREYLQSRLTESDAGAAATGWGGGRYAVYFNEADEETIMVLRLAWDESNEADEFETAYSDWLQNRFGAEGLVQADGGVCWLDSEAFCLYRLGDESLIVRAPSLTVAKAVASIQQNSAVS